MYSEGVKRVIAILDQIESGEREAPSTMGAITKEAGIARHTLSSTKNSLVRMRACKLVHGVETLSKAHLVDSQRKKLSALIAEYEKSGKVFVSVNNVIRSFGLHQTIFDNPKYADLLERAKAIMLPRCLAVVVIKQDKRTRENRALLLKWLNKAKAENVAFDKVKDFLSYADGEIPIHLMNREPYFDIVDQIRALCGKPPLSFGGSTGKANMSLATVEQYSTLLAAVAKAEREGKKFKSVESFTASTGVKAETIYDHPYSLLLERAESLVGVGVNTELVPGSPEWREDAKRKAKAFLAKRALRRSA